MLNFFFKYFFRIFAYDINYFRRIHIHVFEDQKVIYVENAKCGCTTIKYLLKNFKKGKWIEPINTKNIDRFHEWFGYEYYLRPYELKELFNKDFRDYKKFTVLRDPIERFYSLYNDPGKKYFEKYKNPREFLLKYNRKLNDNHVRPQFLAVEGIEDEYDFIGSTDNFDDVIDYLNKTFDLNIKNKVYNKSKRNEKKENRDKKLDKLITKSYKKDWKLYNKLFK